MHGTIRRPAAAASAVRTVLCCALVSAAAVSTAAGSAVAAPVGSVGSLGLAEAMQPPVDPFFSGPDAGTVAAAAPGDVFATRTVQYHLAGIATPVDVTQIVYRTADAQGRPVANVTSVLVPPGPAREGEAVSYQSFYDSLNPADSPSRSIAGDVSMGGLVNDAEAAFIAPLLVQGYPVIVTDTEGQQADFAAGHEYGTSTLDGIRAASRAPGTGIDENTRVGLIGYSGGAIATSWAAALAPQYAPDVNSRLVGATMGGLLVDPARNLHYISGALGWAGVAGMAIVGLTRAYDVDMTPYLNDRGRAMVGAMQDASIMQVLFQFPFYTWRDVVLPQYADPEGVQPFVTVANKANLGSQPTPTIPLQISQGAGGWMEGTDGTRPGIGAGDGVMVAGDVRSLARQYCADGNDAVDYTEYEYLGHSITALPATVTGLSWLADRFAGVPAPSSCGTIAPGNPLTPLTWTPPESHQ